MYDFRLQQTDKQSNIYLKQKNLYLTSVNFTAKSRPLANEVATTYKPGFIAPPLNSFYFTAL